MNVDTAISYLEAMGFIVEESGDDSYLVVDPTTGWGENNPMEPQEFVRLAALEQFYRIYPNWNPEIYGQPRQTKDSELFDNEYYINEEREFSRKDRIDKMSQVFDSEQAATSKVDELNFLEQQPAGYEFGEIEAGIEGEPVVKWEVKRMSGGTYMVVPSDEEEEPTRVPSLPATQENISAAQQQASMLTNATGVSHEFYPEGGQWKFRPIEEEEQEEAYTYEQALRDAPPGFQPRPTSDPNQWTFERTPVTPVRDINQQISQLLGEGRFDEAAKLDQIRDQLNEERLTPERAAEMLVGISYTPSDFKDMMDAILGNDTQLDTTVDIGALQEQASAMLRGDDPLILQGGPVPPGMAPDLASGAAPAMPIPTPRPDRAVGLDQISVAQAGNIPARENRLFQPTEQQEMGMEQGAVAQSPQIFTRPVSGNQVLSPEIAAIGANAAASAERAVIERAAQDEEIRRMQNTPFTSTAAKLKAMEEVMGPRAALYMRNQRLMQPKRQQLFEAGRPLTRRYV